MLNPEKNFILDPRQYKRDKSKYMAFLNFIKIFSDVPQGSMLVIWDIR